MAFIGENYHVDNLPQGSTYDPLPPGWYSASITGAELKSTKSGSGQYIAVKYAITGPTHQGRVVFGNLNIRNQSLKAEEIGRMELGNLMRAIGLAKVTDTDQLIGGNLQIKLEISQQDGYEPRNEVRGYKAIGGPANVPAFASPAPVPSTPPAPQTPNKAAPPWAKK